jgi:phytol kinase
LNPWLGLAMLIGAQLALLVGLRDLRKRWSLHAEVSRKTAHVALGLSMLACPLLFAVAWPLYALAGSAVFVIAVMRWLPGIKERFGGVVGGVDRGSGGDFYFPVSAAVLFALTRGDLILFGVPILILTFADAIAALIGVFYGRLRMTGADKTVEGSLAFFLVAFFATHVPLLLWSDTSRGASLLIALIVGLLVMLLEAVSLYGSDNVFIPFGGYLLLRSFMGMSTGRLGVMLIVVVLVLVLVLSLRRHRSLNDAAMLAAVLVGFLAWSVGGWRWLLPPLVFFLMYAPLWPRKSQLRSRPHDVTSIMAVVSAGLLWLLMDVQFGFVAAYYLYTLAYAAHFTFIGITWHRFTRPKRSAALMIALSAFAAWVVMFVPFVFVAGSDSPSEKVWALTAILCLAAGGAAFMALVRWGRDESEASYPWTRQALIGAATSLLGLVVVFAGGGA